MLTHGNSDSDALLVGGRRLIRWMAFAVAASLLACSADAKTPPPWTLDVRLPEPGYRRADGSILRFTEFRGTRVMWGKCGPDDELEELEGETMARSWAFLARIVVPANRTVCITAVVIGLDGEPMGRSPTIKFTTSDKPGPRRNPREPVQLLLV